jgi:hypothetical protein
LTEILKSFLFPRLDVPGSQYLNVGLVTAGGVVVAYWIVRKNRAIQRRTEKERQRRIDAEVEGYRIRRQMRSSLEAAKSIRES